MSNVLLVLLIFMVGVLATVQPLVNARLAYHVGGTLPSALISFLVGAAALLLAVSASGKLGGLRGVTAASWWELGGGLLGALYVAVTIFAFPRIGSAAAMATLISAQLLAGLAADHYGVFGFRQIAADWQRLLGVGLLLAGALLVTGS